VTAEFLAGNFSGGTLEAHTDKFESAGFGAAKTFDGKGQAFIGMIGDGEDAPGEVVLL
jgi:hypothetical protein